MNETMIKSNSHEGTGLHGEEFEAFDTRVKQLLEELKELMSDGRYGCNVMVAATTGLDMPTLFHRGYLMATGTQDTLTVCLANMLKTDAELCRVVNRAAARASKRKLKNSDGTDSGRASTGGDQTPGVL